MLRGSVWLTRAQRAEGTPGELVGRLEAGCRAGYEEIRFCQRLRWGTGPADSVTKANLVSG